MNLRRALSSWQGWLAGLIAIAIYFTFPLVGRIIDPTFQGIVPVFGVAVIHLIALASLLYFTMIAMTWAGWQIAFKSLDKLYDGRIGELYNRLPPWFSVLMIQLSFVFMVACWIWAMSMAIRLIS